MGVKPGPDVVVEQLSRMSGSNDVRPQPGETQNGAARFARGLPRIETEIFGLVCGFTETSSRYSGRLRVSQGISVI